MKNCLLKLFLLLSASFLVADTFPMEKTVQKEASKYRLIAGAGLCVGVGSLAYLAWKIYKENYANSQQFYLTPDINSANPADLIIRKYFSVNLPARLTDRDLLNLILSDPNRALKYICPFHERFIAFSGSSDIKQMNKKEELELLNQLYHEIKKITPLLMVMECREDGGSVCDLSRDKSPQYRNELEKEISKTLLEKSKTQEKVVYTEFGSGGMFTALVSISKFLHQKPNAKIDIHLIDCHYTLLVKALELLYKKCSINDLEKEIAPEIDRILPELIQMVRKDFRSQDEEEIKYTLLKVIIFRDRLHKEFLKFLKNSFPQATINLFSHSSAETYLNAIEQYNLSYPDVLSACDITDEIGRLRKAPFHYLNLCKNLCQKLPDLKNFYLTKENPKLISYSATPKPGYRSEVFTFDKEQVSFVLYTLKKEFGFFSQFKFS